MSEYFDLSCRDHKIRSGFHWNHGDERLQRLWRSLIVLVRDLDVEDITGGELDGISDAVCRLSWQAEWGPRLGELLRYSVEHRACDVRAKSEYGFREEPEKEGM